MIKILNIEDKNFEKNLDASLSKRKIKIQNTEVSVKKIVHEVKKNGDTSILKY